MYLSLLPLFLPSTALHAQLTKIFVASTGNDANDGSRGSPKRTFQAAHDAVATGGEVVALDTSGYGSLNITKSVGVTAPPGITGFITTTGPANGVVINLTTGTVTLRGLRINAVNKTGSPRGIFVFGVDVLGVSDCVVNGYSNAIDLLPATGANVLISGCTLRSNTSAGIAIGGSADGAVRLNVESCELVENQAGLNVVASGTLGVSHQIVVNRTLLSSNTINGISLGGPNSATLQTCVVSGNNEGIRVTGGGTVRVSDCTVTGNTTGLTAISGASLLSRLNNTLEGNGTNGAFTASYTAK